MSASLTRRLNEQGAEAEALGCYYAADGRLLYAASSVGVDPSKLSPGCRMIAVAGGCSKGAAISAVMRHAHHYMLVTDEAAAQELLRIHEEASHF